MFIHLIPKTEGVAPDGLGLAPDGLRPDEERLIDERRPPVERDERAWTG